MTILLWFWLSFQWYSIFVKSYNIRDCMTIGSVKKEIKNLCPHYLYKILLSWPLSLSRSFYLTLFQLKGYFHPFPLTVGIQNPPTHLISCWFTSFALLNVMIYYMDLERDELSWAWSSDSYRIQYYLILTHWIKCYQLKSKQKTFVVMLHHG